MKILALVMLATGLSHSTFAAETVTGKAHRVKSADPYSAFPAELRASIIHEAKIAALVDAMESCKSESVSRTTPWHMTEDLHLPNCVQYYDGCRMDGEKVLTIDVDAQFTCLPGPTPDLN